MISINTKIAKKISIILIINFLIFVGIGAVLYFTLGYKEIPITWTLGILTFWLIITIIILHKSIEKPFKVILKEIKLLLGGKSYHQIFTIRKDEIGLIAHFFNQITKSLERVSADLKEQKRFSKELNIGKEIQKDLSPKDMPKIEGLDIMVKTKSAAEIGGDSYNFFDQKENQFIYLGDATGHGLPAGLIMIMVDTLIDSFSQTYQSGKEIIIKANSILKPRIKKAMFMTLVLLRWHKNDKKMYFSGAGHEYLIVYRAKTNKCERIKSGGIAMGMLPDNSPLTKEQELKFNKNDIIILYSDGLTEAKNEEGKRYDLEPVEKSIIEVANKSASNIFDHISNQFTTWLGSSIQEDDISLMVIKRV